MTANVKKSMFEMLDNHLKLHIIWQYILVYAQWPCKQYGMGTLLEKLGIHYLSKDYVMHFQRKNVFLNKHMGRYSLAWALKWIQPPYLITIIRSNVSNIRLFVRRAVPAEVRRTICEIVSAHAHWYINSIKTEEINFLSTYFFL